MNKVVLMGRLGKDPELRTAGDKTVVSFSLATTERYKEKEVTQWHILLAWGKTAEIIAKYFKKGSQILVEGKINYQSWESEKGKQYKTVIVVQNFHFTASAQNNSKPPTQAKQEAVESDDTLPF